MIGSSRTPKELVRGLQDSRPSRGRGIGWQVSLGGQRQQALLALLILHRNEPVSTSRLIDDLWGEEPPATAQKTVQVYVSRLRGELGEGRIETHGHGYMLRLDDGELDLQVFEQLVERSEQEVATERGGDVTRGDGALSRSAAWRPGL